MVLKPGGKAGFEHCRSVWGFRLERVYWVDAVRDPISGWKSGLMVLILHYCMGGVAVNFLVGLDYYVDLVLLKTVGRLGNRRAFTAQCVRARDPACRLETQNANTSA